MTSEEFDRLAPDHISPSTLVALFATWRRTICSRSWPCLEISLIGVCEAHHARGNSRLNEGMCHLPLIVIFIGLFSRVIVARCSAGLRPRGFTAQRIVVNITFLGNNFCQRSTPRCPLSRPVLRRSKCSPLTNLGHQVHARPHSFIRQSPHSFSPPLCLCTGAVEVRILRRIPPRLPRLQLPSLQLARVGARNMTWR